MTKFTGTGIKKTNVALVLDSSGSMSSMKGAAIEMFNGQRQTIIDNVEKGGETKVSLVVFGESREPVRVVSNCVAATKIGKLDAAGYQPESMTPMRDGIGRAISLLEAHDDGGPDTANLVIVVTDGQENASREWTAASLSSKVTALQNTGRWTFALYGCTDLNLAELREASGFATVPMGNISTYDRGHHGMVANNVMMADSTASYMSRRAVGVTNTSSFTEGLTTTDSDDPNPTTTDGGTA
jgi:uncharacterized protein YegL